MKLKIMAAVLVAVAVGSQAWNSPLLWRAAPLIGLPTSFTHAAPSSCAPFAAGQIVVAAALRNEGQGWYAINDAGHRPLGIRQVDTTATDIRVQFAFVASKVLTFTVTPDETLAHGGYFAGASVGLDAAIIRLASASVFGAAERSPLGIAGPTSNLWVYGLFEGACA